MNERVIIGSRPWLGCLNGWDWLAQAVPAERLAALRIGTGLTLLIDILFTYWPFRSHYFGPGSLADPDVFAGSFAPPHWNWSLIRWWPNFFTPDVICGVWLVAALALTIGALPRLAALVAWAMAMSVVNTNLYLHNSGDLIRQHLLFFLMLTPCSAAWSVCRPAKLPLGAKAAIYPWALRILFLELICIYFFNGLYKVTQGSHWQNGSVMHYVLHTPPWARWSPPFDLPLSLAAAVSYFVLGWELLFPLMVLVKPARIAALVVGATFHVITTFNLEIGLFGIYALCLYLPLLPWERWIDSDANGAATCARD